MRLPALKNIFTQGTPDLLDSTQHPIIAGGEWQSMAVFVADFQQRPRGDGRCQRVVAAGECSLIAVRQARQGSPADAPDGSGSRSSPQTGNISVLVLNQITRGLIIRQAVITTDNIPRTVNGRFRDNHDGQWKTDNQLRNAGRAGSVHARPAQK